MKKIYFSGSISGGRDDAKIYAEIIKILSKKFDVLTEHIGNDNLTAFGEKDRTDIEIYLKDKEWLDECDFVIAEITTPSLGVGYELAYAEAHNKPVYCFYRKPKNRAISFMITGNKNFKCHEYKDVNELEKLFDELI